MNVLTEYRKHTQEAKTANEAAASLYPEIAKTFIAFVEREFRAPAFPYTQVLDLKDSFWAHTIGFVGNKSAPCVYVTAENQFYRYDPTAGIYQPISEASVADEISKNLDALIDVLPARVRVESLLALKTRSRLRAVVTRAKELVAVGPQFFTPIRNHVAVANGILDLSSNALKEFSPALPFREKLAVKYDPGVKCELFLNTFLGHVLTPDDIDLLQRSLSQFLDGYNQSQTILVLNGESSWGKSTLMKIMGGIFGWDSIGIIREQVFKDDKELSHYREKRGLYHPDMPLDFLQSPEASIFKQLVGGDPLWVDSSDGMMIIHGQFPVVLACNGTPQINLQGDEDAWLRRLVVVSFGKPTHDTHLGRLADIIVKEEGSGILNWLVEGRKRLSKANYQLIQTDEQKRRAVTLLVASQSPTAFIKQCVKAGENGKLGITELYSAYQKWCLANRVPPMTGFKFNQLAREEIEVTFGVRYRHDLESVDGKAVRGWKDLRLEPYDVGIQKTGP